MNGMKPNPTSKFILDITVHDPQINNKKTKSDTVSIMFPTPHSPTGRAMAQILVYLTNVFYLCLNISEPYRSSCLQKRIYSIDGGQLVALRKVCYGLDMNCVNRLGFECSSPDNGTALGRYRAFGGGT